jgi:hypothetical protein
MITQYQIIGLLKQELPRMKGEAYFSQIPRAFSSIHGSIHCLSGFTRSKLEMNHFQTASKCFALAEKIYVEGDVMVKILIERVFIETLILMHALKCSKDLETLIPPILYEIYLRQREPQTPPIHI